MFFFLLLCLELGRLATWPTRGLLLTVLGLVGGAPPAWTLVRRGDTARRRFIYRRQVQASFLTAFRLSK